MQPQSLLIVDDDALVVLGLARSLRLAGWQVQTATSVSEAISIASKSLPDVALVDVLMPEGGAIGFYTGTRERGLIIPTVMMSGARAILNVAKESLRTSVYLLEKPFTTEEATRVLHLAIDAEDCRPKALPPLATKIDDILARATQSTAHIPSLDQTLAAALPLFRSTTSKLETLSTLLKRDAAASVAVLRAANSASVAGNRRIVTIEDTLVRLGQDDVAEIVVQVTFKRVLALKRAPYAAWGRMLWQRSVATACAARALAPHVGINPGEAYTAGLLHDVGESIALCALAQSRLALNAADIAGPVATYHEAMGAIALSYWGLPAPLPQIAGRHHKVAADANDEPLRSLVAFADAIADAAGYTGLSGPASDKSLEELGETFGLEPSALAALANEVVARTKIG